MDDQIKQVLITINPMLTGSTAEMVAANLPDNVLPVAASVLITGFVREEVQLLAIEVLTKLSRTVAGRAKLDGTIHSALKTARDSMDGSGAVRKAATVLLNDLLTNRLPSAPATAPRRAAADSKDLRSLKLYLTGALAGTDKGTENTYIKALLMAEGVMSVTLNKKEETALVYYSFGHIAGADEDEVTVASRLRTKLYGILQTACDEAKDAAGKPRVVLTGRSGYLDDEDEAGPGDENDPFGAGAGSSRAGASNNGKNGSSGSGAASKQAYDPFAGALVDAGATSERTASDRLKAKSGQAAPASQGFLGSLLGGWW